MSSLFLKEGETPVLKHLEGKVLIRGLDQTSHIFKTNEINLSIQGPEVTIMDATKKLQAFLAKLSIWNRRVETDIVANYQMLEEMVSQDTAELHKLSCQFLCKGKSAKI